MKHHNPMRILMFGWEFPPYNSGGLGTACQGLSQALAGLGHEITFVLPKRLPLKVDFMDLVYADVPRVRVKAINSLLTGYVTSDRYRILSSALPPELARLYGDNLFDETLRYADKARALAELVDHDVIHAHDWLAFSAGMAAKEVSDKPLVAHVHATEFDRTGDGHVNPLVYDVERAGMHAADLVLAVSHFTKEKVVRNYQVAESKVGVLHNGVDLRDLYQFPSSRLRDHYKIVLFLGRLTLQKGPDYFLRAAKRALEKDKNIMFVITGSGDMERQLIMQAAELGIAGNVIFTGFRRGKDIDRLFQMADVYVMPSVSEPFGITALESLHNGTPVIVSKQSGVREVLKDAVQVDFWDTEALANEIVSVTEHRGKTNDLMLRQRSSLPNCTWDKAATKCSSFYQNLILPQSLNLEPRT